MIEFLTENGRREYPLEDGNYSCSTPAVTGLIVDASIGIRRVPEDRVQLIHVKKQNGCVSFTVGVPGKETVDVRFDKTTDEFCSAYAATRDIVAYLTASGKSMQSLPDAFDADVGIPFVLKCVSYANRKVDSIRAYSTAECETSVFSGDEEPVTVVESGDVTLCAKDGIDLENVVPLPISEDVIRISALSGVSQTYEEDTVRDIMLRGDDCFTVETLPGSKVDESGDIVKRTASDKGGVLYGGVIRIGTKCKPCCQCEDYENAFDTLRPANDSTLLVKKMLDEAKAEYVKAVEAFNGVKEAAVNEINSYDNVLVSAVSVESGGLYSGATEAAGRRSRIAVTATITNMTMVSLGVGATTRTIFTVPGFEMVSVFWQTAGSSHMSGESIPTVDPAWTLNPGDSLVISGTYAKTTNTNEADTPSGTKVCISLTLKGKNTKEVCISVK